MTISAISVIIGVIIVLYSGFVLWRFLKKRLSSQCCGKKITDNDDGDLLKKRGE